MRWIAVIALALAAGCATPDKLAPATEAARPRPASEGRAGADDILAYLARLREMNETALGAEATRARQAAARDPADLNRLKAALALALTSQSDEGDILQLVEPVTRNSRADADVRAMASFLQVLSLERRRLRESATAARTTLRDERRALEAQKQRADALQERAAQLQQKLDALTELEKSLSDRSPSR